MLRARAASRTLLAATLAIGVAVPSSTAHAAPAGNASVADRARARRAFQEGEALAAKGDLAGALARFAASAAIVPAPATLRQVALFHDRLGHVRDAVEAYEAYLAVASTKEIDEAKARVAELRKAPGRVTIRGRPAHARVTVDGELVVEGLPAELTLPPGEHRVLVEAEGFAAHEAVVDVAFGSSSSPVIELERAERPEPPPPLDLGLPQPIPLPVAPPPAPARPSGPSWASRHVGGLVVGGLAVGALGAGVLFGLDAIDARDAFATRADRATADRGERSAFRADVAFGAAALLGVTAATLLFTDEATPRASLQLAPFVARDGAGLGAGGRF